MVTDGVFISEVRLEVAPLLVVMMPRAPVPTAAGAGASNPEGAAVGRVTDRDSREEGGSDEEEDTGNEDGGSVAEIEMGEEGCSAKTSRRPCSMPDVGPSEVVMAVVGSDACAPLAAD